MTLVEQLVIIDRWYVHLVFFFKKKIVLSIPFLYFNLVLIN